MLDMVIKHKGVTQVLASSNIMFRFIIGDKTLGRKEENKENFHKTRKNWYPILDKFWLTVTPCNFEIFFLFPNFLRS